MTDEQAIRNIIATWMKASLEGDLPAILALMADDVVFLTPGNPPMQGRDAFAKSFQNLKGARIEGSSDIQEIKISGDMAYTWNHLTVTMTPPGQSAPVRREGHTLTIFRKEPAGNWVLARDANLLGPPK